MSGEEKKGPGIRRKFRIGNVRAAKLTPEAVLEIRELYWQQNWTQGALARRFNVSIITIGRIVRGESWQKYPGVGYHEGADEPPAEQRLHEAAIDQMIMAGAPEPNEAEVAASFAKLNTLLPPDKQVGGEPAGETPVLLGDNDHDH
jgi:hypothetical protein